MRSSLISFFIIISFPLFSQTTAIGDWQYHLSFTSAFSITQNEDKIFASTASSVFTIDKSTNEINDFNKNNALSDVGITYITYDAENDYLLIGYLNGNIDLVKEGNTFNLNDIKRATNILGSKKIISATFYNSLIYVSTGFGIVVINLEKREIKETILLGDNGNESPVNQTLIRGDTLYAAADNGLFYIDANNPFISNFGFWTKIENFPDEESNGPFTHVVEYKGLIFVNYQNNEDGDNDIIYRMDGNDWTPIQANQTVNSLKGTPLGLLITTKTPTYLKDENGGIIRRFTTYIDPITKDTSYIKPKDAEIEADTTMWIANERFSIIVDDDIEPYSLIPNGPFNDLSFQMSLFFGELWIGGGAVDAVWGKTWKANGAYHFSNNKWESFNKGNTEIIEEFVFTDVIAVAVNQNNPNQVFLGSYGSGLIEMLDGKSNRAWNADNLEETSLSLGSFGNRWFCWYWRLNF